MSVEISADGPLINLENKSKENRSADGNQSAGDGRAVLNGISNGYGDKKEHKSENKDRHRETDKHHKDHRDRDKDKEKHKEKDRRSSGKEKDRHSSGSSKDKDKDKDKKSKDEKKDKEKSKDHKSSSSSKDHKSSSSSKDKDRHTSSNSSKDKEKHSSSSSSKDKEKHSSSSSTKDKDKHNSSSSSKDKHSISSDKKHGDRDKHRDKSKEKSKSKESETHKGKEITKEDVKVKVEPFLDESPVKGEPVIILKCETITPVKREPQKKDMDDQVDEGYNNSATLSRSIKVEDDTEDEVPLWRGSGHRHHAGPSARSSIGKVKRQLNDSDEDDDIPLSARKKVKKVKTPKKRKQESEDEPEKTRKSAKKEKKGKIEPASQGSPRKKKEVEQQNVWKWWEEEKKEDGKKWNFLEHKGPVFAPDYERLPSDVKFSYNGKEIKLSEGAEEVATFYARMLDHDYTTKEAFNKNFMKDWRKTMTSEEREKITDLSKCNFKHIHAYFLSKTEERKARSKEEKKKLKDENEALIKEFGFCTFDGHQERIGNFKIEPPGLFRGRGEHPKMGMLKKRLQPEDIIINCSKDSKVPKAPEGHRWREVRHDSQVTWLASWTENVQGQVKYIMLNPSSKLKGEKDWQKYEMARKLTKSIGKIREEYRDGWKSKEMRIRQRAVALYFIDKLALRAGNEKDDDQADTVGCCSLRVEHISLHDHKDGKDNVVVFDFLGKDSIRYYNEVSVEKRVYKNLQLFMENKNGADDLFDRLTTTVLNKHLSELMDDLTAKVFRTYNASHTLQQQLDQLTNPEYSVQEKILAYNRANRAVAILCNHQRAVPKTHAKSMENLIGKIEAKKDQVKDAERQYKDAKRECKGGGSAKSKIDMDRRKKALERIKEQLAKMELQATDKEENKEIALGTSKLNYLDPRISVAWCKKNDVPIEKIYNKTQRDKFRWAIDMAGPDYVF